MTLKERGLATSVCDEIKNVMHRHDIILPIEEDLCEQCLCWCGFHFEVRKIPEKLGIYQCTFWLSEKQQYPNWHNIEKILKPAYR